MAPDWIIIVVGAAIAGFVQGLSGFAFTMTAMAIWAWAIEPQLAAASAVFGGLAGQILGALTMRRGFDARIIGWLFAGAVFGVAIGVAILPHLSADHFKIILGAILSIVCPILLIADRFPPPRLEGRFADMTVGVIGGIMGGIGGFTGITPTLWYTLRRFGKDRLRAIVQNFNLGTLTATMAAYVATGIATAEMVPTFLLVLPALLIPWWVGSRIYLGMSEVAFRRVVLGLLALSGLGMLLSSLPIVLGSLY